ncbi:DHHC palmitoyltransferase-domain-containing protein [Mycotypha africana]|uniref:DHHC palmitoyltransferase-domain-containing protein n=1 Tax=Mycotypha africana TaxID=64632 RepID=UPI0023011718|nr:DHHC palmitoyltransferase-domain-containing protein [Mycotypha africana]KAI8979574.1 DHHC palmitoyltransferase-domain-containing protein [Mycotypha africana]
MSMFRRSADISSPTKDQIMPVVSTCRQDGQPRYCHMCECYKPERTHHCRECNACILKMDHHCPWIGGCVGFKNYKFFFLFVMYTAVYALWGLGSSLPIVIQGIQDLEADLDPQWLVLVILAFIFGLTLTAFAIVHGFYIINNQTTIEHVADRPVEIRVDFDYTGQNYEVINVRPEDNLYKRSKLENWNSVMGSNPLLWFVPLKRGAGDGVVFPYNNFMFDSIVSKAIKQRRSLDVAHAGSYNNIDNL